MNTRVSLRGRVISDPEISIIPFLPKNIFFRLDITTKDYGRCVIRVLVSKTIYNDAIKLKKGDIVHITGLFESRIIPKDKSVRKFLYVYAKDICVVKNSSYFQNKVILTGKICDKIIERKDKIDFTLLVKVPNCNVSYIPCVIPLKLIDKSKLIELTEHTTYYQIHGYINSRPYKDRHGKGRVAYEVITVDIEKFR